MGVYNYMNINNGYILHLMCFFTRIIYKIIFYALKKMNSAYVKIIRENKLQCHN